MATYLSYFSSFKNNFLKDLYNLSFLALVMTNKKIGKDEIEIYSSFI